MRRFSNIAIATGLLFAAPANAAKPVNVAAEYAKGESGWPAIVADYKSSTAREDEVVKILAVQLQPFWAQSNMANSYRAVRLEIQRRLEYNDKLKERDKTAGRMLIYRACEQLDKNNYDFVPPFIYGWIKPEEAAG